MPKKKTQAKSFSNAFIGQGAAGKARRKPFCQFRRKSCGCAKNFAQTPRGRLLVPPPIDAISEVITTSVQKPQMVDPTGLEPSGPKTQEPTTPNNSKSKSKVSAQIDAHEAVKAWHELSEVVSAWPKLSSEARSAFMALLRKKVENPEA